MWRLIAVAGGVAFVAFAWLQLNDPDPVPWVLAYGFTAALSGVAAFRPLPPLLAGAWGAICAASAGLILWMWDGNSAPMGPESQGIFAEEVVREAVGLGLVTAWMAVLAVHGWLARRHAERA
jgi:hypothetical protein